MRRGVRLEDQEYRLNQNEVLRLTIDIRPLQRTDGSIHAVLLIFTDHTRVHALQRELEAAKENLENSIEELQSANEELETLNEEARPSNEGMESVNEELRNQAEQAAGYRLYLESVMRLVFPVADALRARGVPFLFATGYDQGALPDRFADAPRVEKPFKGARAAAMR